MDHAETVHTTTTPQPEDQRAIGTVLPPLTDTTPESQTSTDSTEPLSSLPFGWERYAPAGCPYYVDHITSTVHIIRPEGQRRAFLLSQPDIPTDITALPGFHPPEATYSTLISQLILVYRSTLHANHQGGLWGAVMSRFRSRTASDQDLRSTLGPLLHDTVSLQAREDISKGMFRVTSRERWISELSPRQESDWTELQNAAVVVRDIPATEGRSLGEKLRLLSCGHICHSACFRLYARSESMLCPVCPRSNPIDDPSTELARLQELYRLKLTDRCEREQEERRERQHQREQEERRERQHQREQWQRAEEQWGLAKEQQRRTKERRWHAEEQRRRAEEQQRRADEQRRRRKQEKERERQREREREWQRERERERRKALMQRINSYPLMLYVPPPKEVTTSEDGHLEINVTWEDNWVKSDLPYISLEENRAGCYICLMDFEEPTRRDELWDEESGEQKACLEMPGPIIVLPCSHACHKSCVDQWVLESKETCPYCRSHMAPDLGA